jgi:hypothetical protein
MDFASISKYAAISIRQYQAISTSASIKNRNLWLFVPSITPIYFFKFKDGNNNGGVIPDGFVAKPRTDEIIFFQNEKNA